MLKKILSRPAAHLLLILVIGTLVYVNSFQTPFVFDDLDGITGNAVIRDLGNFLPGGAGFEYSRRWVGMLSFALNYRFGGYGVFGYHLVNLAVHLATALLVWSLARLSFRTPYLAGSRLSQQAGVVALLAALFFVAHPVHTQAVTYIVQRLTSLCTFFYLLALVLYVSARLDFEMRWRQPLPAQGSAAPGWRPPLLLAGSTAAALLAMFTKEIAFTLPLAALLYEAAFFAGAWRRRALVLLPLLVLLPIIPLLVFAGGEVTVAGTFLHSRVEIARSHYLVTQFPVIVTYLRLLILPINQNLDYDYPIYTTFTTPPVLLSFLFLAVLVALALYLHGFRFRDSSPSRVPPPAFRLVAFGIFWFFLTLAVESSFISLSDVIFEHRLYLPAIGPAIALAVVIGLAVQKTVHLYGGRLPLLLAAMAITALGYATWQRNQVWHSEISLWEDTARKSPGKSRPWYNLGTYLKDTGMPAQAIVPLAKAVELDPQNAEAWHNLGLAYLMNNRNAEALEALRMAVRIKPEMDNATVNFAVALILAKQPGEAAGLLERNLHRFPDWAEARLNLGIAYIGIGNLPAARRELAVLRRLNPVMATTLADQVRRAAADLPQ